MTLFEAKEPDPRDAAKAKRRNRAIILLLVVVVIVAGTVYWFRHWKEERVVNQFFSLIEQNNFEGAYALWQADPQWKEHTDRYKQYPFGQFQLDWGPSGDYGTITSHKVDGSVEPKNKNGPVSGVVVKVTVNNRVQPACLWVEKKTKVISFSPRECQ
jgi:hypothetical protein